MKRSVVGIQPVNCSYGSETLQKNRRSVKVTLLFLIIIVWMGAIVYHTRKPLPAGLSMEGTVHHVKDVDFLYDLTYKSPEGPVREQSIFERMFRAVEEAEQFIVIDMFLFNSYYDPGNLYPSLSGKMTDKLIAQKNKHPGMKILFITDEVNTMYGSKAAPELTRLKAAGIQTFISDVNPLRDSTPLYSGAWRLLFQWLGQPEGGWLPNPMADSAPPVTLRSYLKLLNVKANHRKVIATENTVIVASANAHDASAYNSNTAFEVKGGIIGDVLASEHAVPVLAGKPDRIRYSFTDKEEGDIGVQLLTEGKIKQYALQALAEAGEGDKVWLGMFYLAEPDVLKALLRASERGAAVRLILDPNENAFGRGKIGLPNRPVARKLMEQSGYNIKIRWYNTSQEQYHTKLLFVDQGDRVTINNGSANFTTRNLDDLNLETNLRIYAPGDSQVAGEVRSYFERLWNNEDATYTLDYEAYQEKSVLVKRGLYTLQEWLGLTTY